MSISYIDWSKIWFWIDGELVTVFFLTVKCAWANVYFFYLECEQEEPKEESDDDMGFSLFD